MGTLIWITGKSCFKYWFESIVNNILFTTFHMSFDRKIYEYSSSKIVQHYYNISVELISFLGVFNFGICYKKDLIWKILLIFVIRNSWNRHFDTRYTIFLIYKISSGFCRHDSLIYNMYHVIYIYIHSWSVFN